MRVADFWLIGRLVLTALAVGVAVLLSGDSVSAAGPGVIERVGPGGPYGGIAISADGRYVAFTDNGGSSIFIRDRQSQTTEDIGAASAHAT